MNDLKPLDSLPKVSDEQIESMKLAANFRLEMDQKMIQEREERNDRQQKIKDYQVKIIILKQIIKDLKSQVDELNYLIVHGGYDFRKKQ